MCRSIYGKLNKIILLNKEAKKTPFKQFIFCEGQKSILFLCSKLGATKYTGNRRTVEKIPLKFFFDIYLFELNKTFHKPFYM